ncbi:hypothetical protein DsansV1_C08g0086211 [Dioscorea sansibarensis]
MKLGHHDSFYPHPISWPYRRFLHARGCLALGAIHLSFVSYWGILHWTLRIPNLRLVLLVFFIPDIVHLCSVVSLSDAFYARVC